MIMNNLEYAFVIELQIIVQWNLDLFSISLLNLSSSLNVLCMYNLRIRYVCIVGNTVSQRGKDIRRKLHYFFNEVFFFFLIRTSIIRG